MEELKVGGIYQHYKGNKYELIGLAKHSETLEELVVYKALYGQGDLWVRPRQMFSEDVNIDNIIIPRFKLLEE